MYIVHHIQKFNARSHELIEANDICHSEVGHHWVT